MSLYFITTNKNKFIEAQHLYSSIKQLSLDLDEIQSNDPHIIIKHKLKEAQKKSSKNFFVEDTSVYFPALQNFPGPNIKWMVADMGITNIAKLIQKYDDKTMIVKACIGLHHNNEILFFDTTVKGTCVLPRGDGHGFTPIFLPDGYDITFAQMTPEQKSIVSHRSLAIKQMKQYLESKNYGY